MTVLDASPTIRRPLTWMHTTRLDLALVFCWVPFALAAALVRSDPGALRWLVAATLLLSLGHQPITMAMVYGDPSQFRQRRRIFTWSPLVLLVAIVAGLQIGLFALALVGALWNTEHTLMQRYGITRIYRRKGGDTSPGRLDLHLLFSWLALTLAWVVRSPGTSAAIDELGLGSINRRSAQVLVDLRPAATVMVVAAVVYALVATGLWFRREVARGFDANPAVYVYLGATAALFAVAVVNPIAGFVGWVGAHAVEYFMIVVTNLDSRYRRAATSPSAVLAKAIRSPLRSTGFVAVFTVVTLVLLRSMRAWAPGRSYIVAFFLVGAMHIWYDGFIWKLRKPEVAESFAIDA